MGRVYLARDLDLDRPVAIKVLHPALAKRAEARERFLREARTAARLTHPHIVPVFAVDSLGDFVWIVMGLVDGESLGARIRRRGPLPPDDAERMLREIAWALSYAHASGVIHRDLTLDNILLERESGRALLADFGLAREVEQAESGPVIGTPGYLAPEVIRGELPDGRADLYALGIVGFGALSGRLPFEGDTAGAVLAKHLVQSPPQLAKLARTASARLVDAISACLVKDPDGRPQDASAFLALLERAPAPIAIAPPLREWFNRFERIRPVYALGTPLIALQTFLLVQVYFKTGSSGLILTALIEAFLTLTLIPTGIQLLFEYLELRRLRAAGFGIEDIQTAAPHRLAEVVRERRQEKLRPLTSRVIFDLTAFGAFMIAFNIIVLLPIAFIFDWKSPITNYLSVVFYGTPYFYLWTMIGTGITLAAPGYRLAPDGRFRRLIDRFWKSRLANKLYTLAGRGQQARLSASATLHRPTELVLGLAVDDLWRALPAELRADLGDVPTLAHTLQASATELRDLADRLRQSEQQTVDETDEQLDFTEIRGTVEAKHRDAVKALEQIRLQLLRLLATRTRTSELTDQLSAARELEVALMHDIAGHASVRRLLKHASRHRFGHTPTPSAA
jgi:serine/threonine-protein kinase